MIPSEIREFIKANKGKMSDKEIKKVLGLSSPHFNYYERSIDYSKIEINKMKGRKKRAEYVKVENKINNETDYSTNGFFDTNKWAKCLPV